MPQDETSQTLNDYILQASGKITAVPDLHTFLNFVMRDILHLIQAEQIMLLLLRPNGEWTYWLQEVDEKTAKFWQRDEVSHSILNEVLKTNRSLILPNAMTDSRFGSAHSIRHLRLRSVMAIPLSTPTKIIGAIYVENRSISNLFTEGDAYPLELFARQIALTIEHLSFQEQLSTAKKQVNLWHKQQWELLNRLSHELRTPVTNLYIYAHLMQIHHQPTSLLQKLESAFNGIQDVFQEFNIAHHLATENILVQSSIVNIELLVQSLLLPLVDILHERRLQIQTVNLDKLPRLMADEEMLRTALEHIISNAVKFTPDGGKIVIWGCVNENNICLYIQDSGIGIAKQDQPFVFEPFYVATDSTLNHFSSKYSFRGGGMGLGLAIARQIIQAHNGSITIESPGRDPETLPGTVCQITLPLLPGKSLTG